MNSKSLFSLVLVIILAVAAGCGSVQTSETRTATASAGEIGNDVIIVDTLATGLDVPWALDFLPDDDIIFTERPGRVRLFEPESGQVSDSIYDVPNILAQGEAGLLGIALHPDFANNHYVYLYHTIDQAGGAINRVTLYVMQDNTLEEDKIILDNIPANTIHDGGRIKFGPDGYLYIGSGDAGNENAAQDIESLSGKILRVTDDGVIPEDNPFPGSPVYSYGHRNPEGLAWDDEGRLWATEHGSSATDELNMIESGKNYGWPVIRSDQTQEGMVTPVINSGGDTWAPSGAAFYNGKIYFTGLRGQSLFEALISETPVTLNRYFQGDYGRLREVVLGSDGFLYVFTNNTDGRGSPASDDDKLLKIDPDSLQ